MIPQFNLIPLLITLSFCIFNISCQDRYASLKALRNDLLINYDRYSRPVKLPSTTVNVTFKLAIRQIIDLDIRSQTFHLDAYLFLSWKDEFLTWDPVKYSGIKRIKFDPGEIWTPDIVSYNMAVGGGSLNMDSHALLSVNNSGQVSQVIASKIVVNCYLDLTDYPFDVQNCLLEFGSWVYDVKELSLVKPSNGRLHYGPYYDNVEWNTDKIVGIVFTEYTDFTNVSVARLNVQVSRRVDIHLYYILIPYLTASLLGLVIFLLPIGSYYRLIFALLSLFILINLLMFLAFNLGFHSLGVPYAVRCISINILLISLSLIITSLAYQVIINLMLTCPPLPSFLAHHLAHPLLGRIFCLTSIGENESTVIDEESNQGEPFRPSTRAAIREWARLLRLVDRLLFISYMIALIIYHS